jgi:hypothetical protein
MKPSRSEIIRLQMGVDDGRIVFEALAEMPFKRVYELIGKLNRQANHSLAAVSKNAACHTLTPVEMGLIVKALGQLPFFRVHRLLQMINDQIRDQMGG